MPTIVYNNLGDHVHANPTVFSLEWDAGLAVTAGAGAPSGVSTVGELYYDETADNLYEATTLDWSAPIITAVAGSADHTGVTPVAYDEAVFNETTDMLYYAVYNNEGDTLVDPTPISNYTFGYWSTDSNGLVPVTTLTKEVIEGQVLYMHLSALGQYVYIPAYLASNQKPLIYKEYIVTAYPVYVNQSHVRKWKINFVVSLGTDYLGSIVYDTRALAEAARDEFILLLASL